MLEQESGGKTHDGPLDHPWSFLPLSTHPARAVRGLFPRSLAPGPWPLRQSRKPTNSWLRLGCWSLRTALASIWRMRSRVTLKMWPTSSKRVAVAVAQAVAELDDLALAVAERLQHLGDAVAEHALRGADGRALHRAVGQEVAEVAVLAVAHRPVEADRIAAHGQHAAGLVDAGLAGAGGLLDRGLAAQLLQELPRHAPHPRHGLDHVDGDADGAALVGHGAGDGLADPPGGVGAELEAAAVLELVHRPHQARVALLDQVEEAQAAVAVLLGDGDDQPQVAFGEAALGLLVLGVDLP